ncbi:hypothetical protein LguiA_032364 [Lonicera macranthoides]
MIGQNMSRDISLSINMRESKLYTIKQIPTLLPSSFKLPRRGVIFLEKIEIC